MRKGAKDKDKDKEKNLNVFPDLSAFEEKIGYKYKNISLLNTALTHTSYMNEMRAKKENINSNERLEFLGDSVLSVITSEYIFNRLKNFSEGELTRVRASIVCEDSLCKFAKSIDLGNELFLGKGEIIGDGRNRPSILADALEAVLGSIFLDGGLDAAKNFLIGFIKTPVDNIIKEGEGAAKDYKTILQQIIQQNYGDQLLYVLSGESGPDHNKIFEIQAVLNNNVIGEGKGRSKRIAEQNAAKEALILFGYSFT